MTLSANCRNGTVMSASWASAPKPPPTVTLRITGRVASSLDPSRIPPDFILQPHVDKASLEMTSFKLTRLGKADGPLIRELGDGFEPLLEELIQKQNERLAEKINRQIEKKKDQLRLSAADSLTKSWTQLVWEIRRLIRPDTGVGEGLV